MPSLRAVLICLFIMLILVVGCGEGAAHHNASARDDAARTTVTLPARASDAQRAKFGLLPAMAVPMRVTGEIHTVNRARCSPRFLFRHTASAMATSPQLAFASGRVQQTVVLFHDAHAAAQAFRTLSSTANERCTERYVHQTVREVTEAALGAVSEQILNVEQRGQESSAYRLLIPVEGYNFPASIDILFNRIGRSLSSVSLIWMRRTPGTIEFQEQLVARIASRAQRALA